MPTDGNAGGGEGGGPIPCLLLQSPPGARPVLVVACAGEGAGFGGMPPFEFLGLLGALPVHRLFLRDEPRGFYMGGVPGAGVTVEEVAAFIAAKGRALGVRRTVLVGNSAGAYGAILLGVLAGADEVIAFAPKSRLREPSDFNDPTYLARFRARGLLDPLHSDLAALLRQRRGPRTRVHVHFPAGCAMDREHAARFRGIPGVVLHPYALAHHGLAKTLRHVGALLPLILSSGSGRRLPVRIAAWRARAAVRWHGWRKGLRRVLAAG